MVFGSQNNYLVCFSDGTKLLLLLYCTGGRGNIAGQLDGCHIAAIHIHYRVYRPRNKR